MSMMEREPIRPEHREHVKYDYVRCIDELVGQIRAVEVRGFDFRTDGFLVEAVDLATTAKEGGKRELSCSIDGCDYQCDVRRRPGGVIEVSNEKGSEGRPCAPQPTSDGAQFLVSLTVSPQQ